MILTEFLLARIAEDEAWAKHREIVTFGSADPGPANPARVLAECEAKRAIIAFHESWPTLVQTPAKFERDDVDLDNYTYRMSQEIAWLTTKEYVARFGTEPPTSPMIAALAAVYADHPDYDEATNSDTPTAP